MSTLAQVLTRTVERVREERDRLNEIDDELIHAIKQVEAALAEIQPGVPVEIQYAARRGGEPTHRLALQKHSGAWRLTCSAGASPMALLLGFSREARADVFDQRRPSGVAPIIALIEEMPRAIAQIAMDREPALSRARALCQGLIALGLVQPSI